MSMLILIYHRVGAGGGTGNPHFLPSEVFSAQIAQLQRFQVLSWRNGLSAERMREGPPRIALTFDDGYRSDLDCAHVLRDAGMDALFFIATGCLGQDPYLQPADVRALVKLGMTVGSHSHSHVQLTSLDDARLRDELVRSREVLESLVQRPIEHLSFPGGAFDQRVLDHAREAGYKHLFTSDWGVNGARQIESGLLRRTAVVNHLDARGFDALLHQRHRRARQLAFAGKELVKKAFGVERYVRWRRALLELRR
jgi:peptidoglycan/xylan/chitin deacetylase (PgdA/CDA1 family)